MAGHYPNVYAELKHNYNICMCILRWPDIASTIVQRRISQKYHNRMVDNKAGVV